MLLTSKSKEERAHSEVFEAKEETSERSRSQRRREKQEEL
jgi:hypothetical protein